MSKAKQHVEREEGYSVLAKIIPLFDKLPDNRFTDIEEIEQQYQEYYANEEDTYPSYVGNCFRCGLPITEFDPLWQITRIGGYGEDDSMIVCEECLLRLIKH